MSKFYCRYCHKPFEIEVKPGPLPYFCGSRCRQANYRDAKRARHFVTPDAKHSRPREPSKNLLLKSWQADEEKHLALAASASNESMRECHRWLACEHVYQHDKGD